MAARELYKSTLYNDANLVSYWRFEGNSNDAKGTNNGTDTSITYGVSNGRFAQGASFNNSAYIRSTHNSSQTITGSITISAWVKVNSAVAWSDIVWKGRDNGGSDRPQNYMIDLGSTGLIPRFGYTASNNYHVWQSGTSITTGTWNHIVTTFTYGTGSSIKMYINGVAVSGSWAAGDGSAAPGTVTDDLLFGGAWVSGAVANKYNGAIDDVALFSRALTEAEVHALYTGAFKPLSDLSLASDGNLVSYWKLDGNSTDTKGVRNGTDTSMSYAAAKFSSGAVFGASSKINIGSLNTGTSDWTINMWMKAPTPATNQPLFCWGSPSNSNAIFLVLASTGKFRASVWSQADTDSTATIGDSRWHMITATSLNKVVSIYVDGAYQTQTNYSTMILTNTFGYIGAQENGTPTANGVTLDDIAHFSRALTPGEVFKLYQGVEPKELNSTTLATDANLVSYYRLEGNGSDTKNTNNASATTNVSFGTSYGMVTQGALFNGSSAYITVPDSASLDNTGNRTFSFWFYSSALPGTGLAQWIFRKGLEAANGTNYGMYIGNVGGTIRIGYREVAGNGRSHYCSQTLQAGKWYHCALTLNYGETEPAMYIDGVRMSAVIDDSINPTYSAPANTYPLYIGSNQSDTSKTYFNGYLDDFAYLNRKLTDEEIWKLYSGEGWPSTTNASFLFNFV